MQQSIPCHLITPCSFSCYCTMYSHWLLNILFSCVSGGVPDCEVVAVEARQDCPKGIYRVVKHSAGVCPASARPRWSTDPLTGKSFLFPFWEHPAGCLQDAQQCMKNFLFKRGQLFVPPRHLLSHVGGVSTIFFSVHDDPFQWIDVPTEEQKGV